METAALTALGGRPRCPQPGRAVALLSINNVTECHHRRFAASMRNKTKARPLRSHIWTEKQTRTVGSHESRPAVACPSNMRGSCFFSSDHPPGC